MMCCLVIFIAATIVMQYSIAAKKQKSSQRKPKARESATSTTTQTEASPRSYVKCKNSSRHHRHYRTTKHRNVWYPINENNTEIYVYSALFDNRTAGGNNAFVRILAIGKKIRRLFCRLWYPPDWSIAVRAKIAVNGAGHWIDGELFKQYYFSCILPFGFPFTPTHVSLSTVDQCGVGGGGIVGNVSSLIPIMFPENPGFFSHEFAICVPITFWYVDPYRIVEWIEMNRLFGVTEINVYACNVSEITMAILRYFQQDGILKLHNVPPAKNGHTRNGVKLASPISINDCMWKNMYRYRYVLILDLDEIIVPNLHTKYKDMLEFIDKIYNSVNYKSYSFRNAYFWVGCLSPAKTITSYMKTFTAREDPSEYGISVKSILDPRRCLSAFNHRCLAQFQSLKSVFPRKFPEREIAVFENNRSKLFKTSHRTADRISPNAKQKQEVKDL